MGEARKKRGTNLLSKLWILRPYLPLMKPADDAREHLPVLELDGDRDEIRKKPPFVCLSLRFRHILPLQQVLPGLLYLPSSTGNRLPSSLDLFALLPYKMLVDLSVGIHERLGRLEGEEGRNLRVSKEWKETWGR
jgi:hypothetical protein